MIRFVNGILILDNKSSENRSIFSGHSLLRVTLVSISQDFFVDFAAVLTLPIDE